MSTAAPTPAAAAAAATSEAQCMLCGEQSPGCHCEPSYPAAAWSRMLELDQLTGTYRDHADLDSEALEPFQPSDIAVNQ